MTTLLLVVAAALAGALIAGGAFYLVFFSSRKNDEAGRAQLKEDLRTFLELAEQKFETERVRQKAELDEKRASVEASVSRLSEQLKGYEQLVRGFEADRGQKFGSLEKGLKDAAETTGKLAATTESLRALLDNSRARGQWGERMAEDILRACGLKEDVQYRRNRAQDASSTRPDFTFLLPDDHRVHMDVKFPLDNYVRMVNAQAAEEKARFKAEFLRDVKARIKEIQKRDYINPSERTLDYVILFIPNEQVYGFIHESLPGLLDESLAQKVVLCAPSTLYAVLAVIRQAFDNFHLSQATQEVLKLISHFTGVYEKFRERFGKLGESLEDVQKLYGEISDVSFKRLDAAIVKIEKVRKGDRSDEPAVLESGKEMA
jgi:DNA recombination protein RmuC